MSLTQYLDLAYSVVVEERMRRGSSLFDALDSTTEWAASARAPIPGITPTRDARESAPAGGNSMERADRVDPGGPGAPLTPEEIANGQALAAFEAMMSGVGGTR